MRATLLLGLLASTTLVGCTETICDESWPANRTAIIRDGICAQDNVQVIEDSLGALDIQATPGTMVVIDTNRGSITRIPSAVTGPENSRSEPVELDVPEAEVIRTATQSPSFLISPEGVGFLVAQGENGAMDEAVFVATSITIGAGTYVRVIGERPLVLVSPKVTIDGIIDIAAGCPDNPVDTSCPGPGGGAGALFSQRETTSERSVAGGCAPGGNGARGSDSDTGGGGGGLGAAGGAGGNSATPEGQPQTGGAGGDVAACPGEAVEPLSGGSGGGFGEGDPDTAGNGGGNGGGGGGAIRVTASSAIRIGVGLAEGSQNAGIWAGGGGGGASTAGESGGGGGGSGGAIVLEAPAVEIANAILAANGGGGGRGGVNDPQLRLDGAYGTFGDSAAAGGGDDEHAGGAGGAGTFEAAGGKSADAGAGIDGTGGGGGSVGRIRINTKQDGARSTGSVVSPAASQGELVRED